MVDGVSVIICAHNSSQRITPTLAHLAAQQVPAGLPWEILLIDNGSTDDTAAVAARVWTGTATLRVIHEPQLGLSFARWRGVHDAAYEIVSFIDDDNWVCADWVATVADIMTQHPEVGACGGHSEAVFEAEPPTWFYEFANSYAVNKTAYPTGDISETNARLVGAGLSIRRDALLTLEEQGFRSLLTDRKGSSLSSGGDTELCLALQLAGWRLWYDNRLRLQHYLPANRLQWSYLRRLMRASAISSMTNEAYRVHLSDDRGSLSYKFKQTWQGQAVWQLRYILKNFKRAASYYLNNSEGNSNVIWMEWQIGRLLGILQQRSLYNDNLASIKQAKWQTKVQG